MKRTVAAGGAAVRKSELRPQMLRMTDPETARLVAIHRADGVIVGAGCLVDRSRVLTCRHIAGAALAPERIAKDLPLKVTAVGVTGQPMLEARLRSWGGRGPHNDLALLDLVGDSLLEVPPIEFASPMRHARKAWSLVGFPAADRRGRAATGMLQAADAAGLVELDRGGAFSVLGGFSGAPVFSPDLCAFVGIALQDSKERISWCIPSRRLSEFAPDLSVRFRMPPGDRPATGAGADPISGLFGQLSNDGTRQLQGSVRRKKGRKHFDVSLRYQCRPGGTGPRGHWVTFITDADGAAGFELFSRLKLSEDESLWYAEVRFKTHTLFTAAAVADAGDSSLTLDLRDLHEE